MLDKKKYGLDFNEYDLVFSLVIYSGMDAELYINGNI